MNVNENLDAELDMEEEPQEDPEGVEFNHDVCEPFSLHY
jgi:hypothetical protein